MIGQNSNYIMIIILGLRHCRKYTYKHPSSRIYKPTYLFTYATFSINPFYSERFRAFGFILIGLLCKISSCVDQTKKRQIYCFQQNKNIETKIIVYWETISLLEFLQHALLCLLYFRSYCADANSSVICFDSANGIIIL